MADVKHYPIDEKAARIAHEMNSMRTYKEGRTTADYQAYVNQAADLALRQKANVDPMYHEKIDGLLDAYARKLADWYNRNSTIESMCPSIMISGGGNFPVRKKEKQNAARERHMGEWEAIKGLLGKIEAAGTGGISSDDPDALAKLRARLSDLESIQNRMKAANKQKRGTHQPWELSNNSANIRRIKGRIAEMEKRAEKPLQGWAFDGGEVVANAETNRLQIFFGDKPGEALRCELKRNGFRWAPSAGAWQRQLTGNAVSAAKALLPKQDGKAANA